MTVFTGHSGNAGHFLQPTASAMGHRTTPFSQGSRQLGYALSRAEAKHTKLESTVRYLGIAVDGALEIAEQTEV